MEQSVKQELTEILRRMVKQEIKLNWQESDAPLPCGSSKIGGQPDVPSDFVWPEYEGSAYGEEDVKRRPLSFLAQINLRDVAAYDQEHLLPTEGILSFFYELESMTWGFDPKDEGSAKVYWFPDTDVLSSAAFPEGLEQDYRLPELAITYTPQISLPSYYGTSNFPMPDGVDWDGYYACCEECGYKEEEDVTKLLGYPDVIQNPMEKECETITRGWRGGSPDDYKKIPDDEQADIRAKAPEWRMLFQMGTVETDDYELMFCDCGHIYFWIRREDLLNRRFDKIWLILQCY